MHYLLYDYVTLGKSSVQIIESACLSSWVSWSWTVYLKMEENVKSNNDPSKIRIPPGFGKISDGLDREKVDTFAYQEQSKVQKLVLKAKTGAP